MQNQIIPSPIKYHNNIQIEYFAEEIKKTMVPVDSYYVNRHIDEFLQFSGITSEDKILEVGCGMGKFTFPLLKKGFRLTGLDLSPFLLQKLLEYNDNTYPIELICSDILNIPYEYDGTYDYVIGFFTLHHFFNLHSYFKVMKRILKPGGSIIFIEPNAFNPLYYFQILFSPGMTWEAEKGVVMMRKSQFLKASKYAGLGQLSLHKYGFLPPFAVNHPVGQKVDNALEKMKIFNTFSAFQIIKVNNDY